MYNVKLKRDFIKLSDAGLAARSAQIVNSLTANFSTAPFLPGLITLGQDFAAKLALAITGDKVKKAEKNAARQELIVALVQAIPYLEMTCGDDDVLAAKTGYSVVARPGSSPMVTPATNITVSNGLNPGELALRFDTVPGAYGYSYQYTLDPITESSIWSSTIGKRIKYTFTGLQTGQRYWVRVVAVGRNEQAAESEPVLTRIVQ